MVSCIEAIMVASRPEDVVVPPILKPLPKTQTTEFRVYLGIQKSTVLGVRPNNFGVIASYFVGFGVTGMA